MRQSPAILAFGFGEHVRIFRSAEQCETQWHEGVAIRPAQRQHPKTLAEFMAGVVKNLGQQFNFLAAVTAQERIVNHQNRLAVIGSQRIDFLYQFRRAELEQAFPVESMAVEETIGGILAKGQGLVLTVQRAIQVLAVKNQ